jgi:hypothetical protein
MMTLLLLLLSLVLLIIRHSLLKARATYRQMEHRAYTI